MLGGTASYAARVVHAFGLRTALLTSAAYNEPLLNQLTPYLVDKSILPAPTTSTFENIYTPTGRIQYIRGVAASIGANDVPPEWLPVPLVHLAPLTDEVDPRIVYQFPNSIIMLTLQGWLRRWDDDGRVHFKPWYDPDVLEHINIVVFSEEDIAEAPELEAKFASSVEHLFVTRAEHGGTYYHDGTPIDYSTLPVEVVNPTGAGDIFASSLLAALYLSDGNMDIALRVAVQLAATSVTRVGMDGTPTPDEILQAFKKAEHEFR